MLLGGVLIIVATDGGLIELMPVLIAGSTTYLFFSLFFIRDRYRVGFAYDPGIIKEILKRSWPIALGIIFNLIYLKADTIILSLTRSQAEVGIYGASFRILEVAHHHSNDAPRAAAPTIYQSVDRGKQTLLEHPLPKNL